jgi:carboxypeptidase family protein/TonB-dependent receptor-like protein
MGVGVQASQFKVSRLSGVSLGQTAKGGFMGGSLRRFAFPFALFAALLLIPVGLWAQGGSTGAITGVVEDQQGGAIPNAKIEVINKGMGVKEREVTSGTAGAYTVPLLPPAIYRLEVTAPNFAKYVAESVEVRVTETTTVNIKMQVGAITQVVTVTEAAVPVNLSNPTTGQVIGPQTVSNLPLSNRNYLTLLALSAGANGEISPTADVLRGSVTINVNGQRPVNNNYVLEGINSNDVNLPILDNVALPNPDAIQEFKTQTSLYDASQGRNGGGNIQATIRSGTSGYHGDVFGFLRNNVVNSNDFFLNESGKNRPVVRQGQYGASLGGPVAIGKDFFFFANYQGTRALSAQAPGTTFSSSTIPVLPTTRSAANLATVFFPNGNCTGVGTTRTTLNTNCIPQTGNPFNGGGAYAIDPSAVAFLNLPASTCPGFNDGTFCIPTLAGTPGPRTPTGTTLFLGPTLAAALPGTYFENQFTYKLDKQVDVNDKVTGSVFTSNFHSRQPFGNGSSLPFAETFPNTNRFIKVGWTRTLSPRAVNEVRLGFNRFSFKRIPTEPISLADVGATRGNSSLIPAAYRISISGLFSLGTGVNDDRGGAFNTFYLGDDYSHTLGKHTLRVGYEMSRYQLNRFNRFATRGSVAFSGGTTLCTGGAVGCTANGHLNAFQNFLLGNINSTQGGAGFFNFYFRALDAASYFQDDWKFSPRLTLNLGLRWEGISTAHEKFDHLSNFLGLGDGVNPNQISIIHPETTPRVGTPGVQDCTLKSCFSWHNFAPRIGFAYDLRGNQKWVLRAGFGTYFQRISNQSLLQSSGGLPFNEQFSASPLSVTLQNPFPSSIPDSAFPLPFNQVIPALTTFNSATGAPMFQTASGGPTSGFFFFPVRNLRPPYAEQWNLTVQHELFKGWVLETGYVGSRGVHLLGPGRPLDGGQVCTATVPCVIPPAIGSSVLMPNAATAACPGGTAGPTIVGTTALSCKQANGSINITGSTGDNLDARVPTLFLGLANSRGFFQENSSASTYHSLQATLSHQWANGLYFQGAYTFSKSIDNGSGSVFGDELNGLTQFGDLFNVRSNRGISDFDRRHRLVVSYNYELPFGKWFGIGSSGLGKIANGWAVNGVSIFQSGIPFVLFDSSSLILEDTDGINGTNFSTVAAGTTKGQILTPGGTESRLGDFVNLDPATGTPFITGGNCVDNQNNPVSCSDPTAVAAAVGNIGRNRFRGPFQQTWNISIVKSTKVTERYSVDFRTEFFNAFNHPAFQGPQAAGGAFPASSSFGNYGLVDTSVGPGGSAILATVNGPRIIQFALLFKF